MYSHVGTEKLARRRGVGREGGQTLEHRSPLNALLEMAHSSFPENLTILLWGKFSSLLFARRKLGLRELEKLG